MTKRVGNYARGDAHWSHQHPENVPHGAEHFNWKGDDVDPKTGRCRARTMFPLGPCEHCGKERTERHHKDGNPLNNDPGNIAILCRRCHMQVDGRAHRLSPRGVAGSKAKAAAKDHHCIHCGEDYPQLRKGLCAACNEYRRRTGQDRPLIRAPRLLVLCGKCGTSCYPHAFGLCDTCYERGRNRKRVK